MDRGLRSEERAHVLDVGGGVRVIAWTCAVPSWWSSIRSIEFFASPAIAASRAGSRASAWTASSIRRCDASTAIEFGCSSATQMLGCKVMPLGPLSRMAASPAASSKRPVSPTRASGSPPRRRPLGVAALEDGRVRLPVTIGDVGQHLVPDGLLREPDGFLRAFFGLTAAKLGQRHHFAPNRRLALHPAVSSLLRHPGRGWGPSRRFRLSHCPPSAG